MSEEALTKVHIDLPNHWRAGGESFWAEDLGNNLYRLRNVPFLAYGLNFYDVVEAIADSPDLKPEIRRVVEFGGHRTLRLYFEGDVETERQAELLESLNSHSAYYERGDSVFVAIDVEPDGNYQAVFDQLLEWEKSGLLAFESCEARQEGSFDDRPEEVV